MPKRKNSIDEKLDHYKKKIKKLESKRRGRIRNIISSSEDENENFPNVLTVETNTDAVEPEIEEVQAPPLQEVAEAMPLDPEILTALGESLDDSPEFGEDIHNKLSTLWTPLLKKGLSKEEKEKLFKDYLVPGNCKFLQAPKLNAEISAAVSDIVRGRDKKLTLQQQQLGVGIAAVNKAIDCLLRCEEKTKAIKYMSDSCRILCDLHSHLTKDRTKLVMPSLDKSFLHVINEAERDDTLFGQALSEKIKASKAIAKQGSQIRKPDMKATAPQASASRPAPTPSGNWAGPPRFSSHRGGRGGQKKQAPPGRRSYPSSQPQKSLNQPKPRAPVQ